MIDHFCRSRRVVVMAGVTKLEIYSRGITLGRSLGGISTHVSVRYDVSRQASGDARQLKHIRRLSGTVSL